MWKRSARIVNAVVGAIGNVFFMATTGALFVTGLVGGFVETVLGFPWYWRVLTIIGGAGLILSLATVSLSGVSRLMARRRAKYEQTGALSAGIQQTLMHLGPSASVQGGFHNIAMTVGEKRTTSESERTPIRLNQAGLERLEKEMMELASSVGDLLVDMERRKNEVRVTYWARDEFDEDTRAFLSRQYDRHSAEIQAELEAVWTAQFAGRVRACTLIAADNGFTDTGMNDVLRTEAEWIIRKNAPSALVSLAEQIRHSRPNPTPESSGDE